MLRLIFLAGDLPGTSWTDTGGTAYDGIATAGPLANLYVSLHSADIGVSSSQLSNEVAYGGYARVAIPRTSAYWTLVETSTPYVVPVNDIVFPECTGGTATAAFFAIGTLPTGAGEVLYSGALASSILIEEFGIPAISKTAYVMEL